MNNIDTLTRVGPLSRGALRNDIVKQLLHAIFRGQIQSGTRLMVMKLAERFGTSSTPVREALVELASIAVVDFIHNRGAIVNPFGPKELREIYQLRRILETEAARTCCDRLAFQQVSAIHQELLDLLGTESSPAWIQKATATDRRLHEMIATGCGSVRLAREIRRYDTLVQTIREIIGEDYEAQRRALTEHLAIVEALESGKPDQAGEAMARHIQSAAEICEAAMFGRR